LEHPSSFKDEMHRDIKKPGCIVLGHIARVRNVRGRYVRGRNIRGRNVQASNVPGRIMLVPQSRFGCIE
jgi:hypothetical protein